VGRFRIDKIGNIKRIYLDLSAEVLLAGELSRIVGERCLHNASVVPSISVKRLAVLVPQGDVHVL